MSLAPYSSKCGVRGLIDDVWMDGVCFGRQSRPSTPRRQHLLPRDRDNSTGDENYSLKSAHAASTGCAESSPETLNPTVRGNEVEPAFSIVVCRNWVLNLLGGEHSCDRSEATPLGAFHLLGTIVVGDRLSVAGRASRVLAHLLV